MVRAVRLSRVADCCRWVVNPRLSALAECSYHTVELLRGTIVNRTYGIHKNLYIEAFLLTIFGPINYGPP